MIPVVPAPEPAGFDVQVRQPGLDSIAELTGGIPSHSRSGPRRKRVADGPENIPPDAFPAFWTRVLPEILIAYDRRCAYLALHIEPATGNPTVDHFTPKSKAWNLVYEWSNYRLAAGLINSKKQAVENVLDPFEIGPDWFCLEFVTFQVKSGPGALGDIADRVDDTITKLGLNRDECCKARQAYFDAYLDEEDPIPFSYLARRAPFVANEMGRQGYLRAEDT